MKVVIRNWHRIHYQHVVLCVIVKFQVNLASLHCCTAQIIKNSLDFRIVSFQYVMWGSHFLSLDCIKLLTIIMRLIPGLFIAINCFFLQRLKLTNRAGTMPSLFVESKIELVARILLLKVVG